LPECAIYRDKQGWTPAFVLSDHGDSMGRQMREDERPVSTMRQRGEACIIEVERELDVFTSSSLASAIEGAARIGGHHVVVSLEACTYCDASALTVLIRAKKLLGSALSICVSHGHSVRRIFEVTNLAAPLALRASLEEALASHCGSPRPPGSLQTAASMNAAPQESSP